MIHPDAFSALSAFMREQDRVPETGTRLTETVEPEDRQILPFSL